MQAGVAQPDVHRVGVVAQVDALFQCGQRLTNAHGHPYLAVLEVEVGVVVHGDTDGSAAERGVDAATLVVEVLLVQGDVAVEQRPYLTIFGLVELVAEVEVQPMAVLAQAAVESVRAVHHLLVFGHGGQVVNGGWFFAQAVEQVERRAAVAPVVGEVVGGMDGAPALAQGNVVARCGLDSSVAVGVVVGEVVEGARPRPRGGGTVSSEVDRLPIEEMLVAVAIADGGTEAQVLVGVRNLDGSPSVKRALQGMSTAEALLQNSVDERVAQVDA